VYDVPHVMPVNEKLVEAELPAWLPFKKSR
jgi:hypothetical protein